METAPSFSPGETSMPITDQYARLPLSAVFIDRDKRQRRELDSKGLIDSIRNVGVLNPIIVEREANNDGCHQLVAGERRYIASLELELADIPVRFADELDDIEREIFELEENVKRIDLDWQDTVKATARIHQLYRDREVGWSQEDTANALGLTGGTVSIYLAVHRQMDDDKIHSRDTVREAYNIIKTREKREDAAIVDSLLRATKSKTGPTPTLARAVEESESSSSSPVVILPEVIVHDYRALQNPAKNILLESFLHWAPKYSGPPFNLIHCDFPYGISVFDGPQAGGDRHQEYDDSREIHFKLLETLLTNFNKIASMSCHVVYWFSMQHYDQIRQMVRDLTPDLVIHTHPLIWIKSDNSGIASDVRHVPRHVYETALLMSRGKRHLVQLASDAYSAPTDRTWHIHAKPEPVLKHFFTMLVDEHTNFLDPTCGSGSAVRAAELLGAKTVLGMDIDETIVGQARRALRHSRAKAGMAAAD